MKKLFLLIFLSTLVACSGISKQEEVKPEQMETTYPDKMPEILPIHPHSGAFSIYIHR